MTAKKENLNYRIRIGTSSFSSKDWIGPFYPEGMQPAEFLGFYSQHFNTVEVDATYYRVPSKGMVAGWNDKTPEDFLLCAKFPRAIVHAGDKATPDPCKIMMPDETYDTRDAFLEAMSKLGKKLGPLLIQFPYFSKKIFPSAEEFTSRLDSFLADLPDDFRYAVEIRNRNWLNKEFAELLRSRNICLALADQAWMPHGDEIMEKFDPITTDFFYVRLIGNRKEIEKITKSWEKEVIDRNESLDRWADLFEGLYSRNLDSLVYVNNHYAGHAPQTARRLSEKIRQRIK